MVTGGLTHLPQCNLQFNSRGGWMDNFSPAAPTAAVASDRDL